MGTIVGSRIVLSYLRILPNEIASAVAEVGETRGLAKENTASKTRSGHSAGPGAFSALARVHEVARADKGARFTALLHHVDLTRLRAAYRAIRPKAALGAAEVAGPTDCAVVRTYK
jgi:hypothetical protein